MASWILVKQPRRATNRYKSAQKFDLKKVFWKKGYAIWHKRCYTLSGIKDIAKERRCFFVAKYTALQIAKWFLAHNNIGVAEDGGELISNLKLQKLLYYAQGTYLGITGEKLFKDPIVAWKHGPVVESVYQEYKSNGSNGIVCDEEFSSKTIDSKTSEILESVYDNFAQFSAWKLREMTHAEKPWKETEQSEEISIDKIKKFFLEEYIEQ